MKIGLVGFSGSGKSTVFRWLTGVAPDPSRVQQGQIGTAKLPDPRVDKLSAMFKPKKTTYAEISFCDVPGEHGADKKGLSTKSLQQIRDQEALCLVLRDFDNPAVDGKPDPLADLEGFHTECVFADLELIERRLARAKKEKTAPDEVARFELMRGALEEGRPLRSVPQKELDRGQLKNYVFLTDRPLLVAVNRDEGRAKEAMPAPLGERISALQAGGLVLSASVEAEIAGLAADEQKAFLDDLGLSESALTRFIRAAYGLLDLISFFTVGEDEVRAWTIRRGTNARVASGRIHSDLERGFIRAEVIPYEVFVKYGSEHAVKEAGKFQVEGKEYIVADGDIMHVRFNV
jgi:GTP-binding protein YchF